MKLSTLINESESESIIPEAPDSVWQSSTSRPGVPTPFQVVLNLQRLPAEQYGYRYQDVEDYILADSYACLEYACFYIQKRWIEAEPIIATNAKISYDYAVQVMRGRFPLGERTMKKNDDIWIKYIMHLKKTEPK